MQNTKMLYDLFLEAAQNNPTQFALRYVHKNGINEYTFEALVHAVNNGSTHAFTI